MKGAKYGGGSFWDGEDDNSTYYAPATPEQIAAKEAARIKELADAELAEQNRIAGIKSTFKNAEVFLGKILPGWCLDVSENTACEAFISEWMRLSEGRFVVSCEEYSWAIANTLVGSTSGIEYYCREWNKEMRKSIRQIERKRQEYAPDSYLAALAWAGLK